MVEKTTELAVSLAALVFAISVLATQNLVVLGYNFTPIVPVSLVATGVGVLILTLRFLYGQVTDLAAKVPKK